jgi:hypothetical protein
MKIVQEHINEKFTEESDPIKDLNIGVIDKINEWIEKNMQVNRHTLDSDMKKKCEEKPLYIINDNGTINVYGTAWINFGYSPGTYSNLNLIFPKYINFNIIYGNFDMGHRDVISLRGCPQKVYGYFRCSHNNLTSLKYCPKWVEGQFYCEYNAVQFIKEDVKKYCKHIGKEITL